MLIVLVLLLAGWDTTTVGGVSAYSAIEGLFNDHQRCPACLLFTTQLYVQMALSQGGYDLDPYEHKKFLKREDRVLDVLEAAIKSSTTEFAWVESDTSPGIVERTGGGDGSPGIKGRYWLIKNMRNRKLLTPDMEKSLAKQIKSGGDSGFLNFMRLTVIGENEEEVEELVKKNDLDPKKGIHLLCVKLTKTCPAHVAEKLSDLHPMDDEDFTGQQATTKQAPPPPPPPKPLKETEPPIPPLNDL